MTKRTPHSRQKSKHKNKRGAAAAGVSQKTRTTALKRVSLFVRMVGVVGGVSDAISSECTNFILMGLREACAYDPSVCKSTVLQSTKMQYHWSGGYWFKDGRRPCVWQREERA